MIRTQVTNHKEIGTSINGKHALLGFSKHYTSGPAELLYNRKPVGVKDLEVIFDSGSSYTYFNSRAYEAVVNQVT